MTPIQAQIDHVDASIVSLKDALAANRVRKRPDDLDAIREMKIAAWTDIRDTLSLVFSVEPEFRDLLIAKRGRE